MRWFKRSPEPLAPSLTLPNLPPRPFDVGLGDLEVTTVVQGINLSRLVSQWLKAEMTVGGHHDLQRLFDRRRTVKIIHAAFSALSRGHIGSAFEVVPCDVDFVVRKTVTQVEHPLQ